MHKLFPSQLADEQIFLIVRESWVLLVLKLIVVAILFMLWLAVLDYGPTYAPVLFTGTIGIIVQIIGGVYVMILTFATFIVWVFYYVTIEVITNIRIVDLEQRGLFHHTVSELHIDKIEDVTSESKGILATIFNFGNVYVQTAGTIERFVFKNVPAPDRIEKLILDLYERRPQAPTPGQTPTPTPGGPTA